METPGLRGSCLRDEPLARYTSWGVGGPADCLYRPADLADLVAFLAALPESEPLHWLGLGSNVLIRDGGLRGTVILMRGAGSVLRVEDDGTVYAEAAVSCAKLARFLAREQLTGGEFLAGIPGTLGGALAMNAGAYGGETWDAVVSVDCIDRRGRITSREPDQFRIAYRSVAGPQGEWFVAARLRFESGAGAAARQRIAALLERRAATQPIGQRSCGSVFRNPPGDHAARLIEHCGLKGERIGGAQVSEKHANFIVNTGAATAGDIEQLVERVRATVAERTGVELRTEVRVLGEPA